VYALCGAFLKAFKERVESQERRPSTLKNYVLVCRLVIRVFGKNRLVSDLGQKDWRKLRAIMAKKWGPKTLHDEMVRTIVPFNWAFDADLLPAPVKFGVSFDLPSEKTLMEHRNKRGEQMFEAHEIRTMLGAAGPALRAMIMLGINCGFGNADIAALPMSALDLERGWVSHPRVKTAVKRRCKLFPETVEALREWLVVRPEPMNPEHGQLVFITNKKHAWSSEDGTLNPLSLEMKKLVTKLGLDKGRVRRPTFYDLRHTTQTIGDECGDYLAVRAVMGHKGKNDISDVYRERMSDARLEKVAATIRGWLFDGHEDGTPDVLQFGQAQ